MMNKKIILLLLALLAAKIYCMEPAKKEMPEEESWRIIPTAEEKRKAEQAIFEEIRHPEKHPEKPSYFACLPYELQDELLKYATFTDFYANEYNKLIDQENIYTIEELYLPSYEVFGQLIEKTKDFYPGDLSKPRPSALMRLRLESLIATPAAAYGLNAARLSYILLSRKKFDIINLFIKKKAVLDWHHLDFLLIDSVDELWRKYSNVGLFLKEAAPYINTFQILIEYAPLTEKEYIKKSYFNLLRRYPELRDISDKIQAKRIEEELLEQEREQEWELLPPELEPQPKKGWFSNWF